MNGTDRRLPEADGTVLDSVPLPVNVLNSSMLGESVWAIRRRFAVAGRLDG